MMPMAMLSFMGVQHWEPWKLRYRNAEAFSEAKRLNMTLLIVFNDAQGWCKNFANCALYERRWSIE
jgi:hypothetical protein